MSENINIDNLNKVFEEAYPDYCVKEMIYGLQYLWNRRSSITSIANEELRNEGSRKEENAAFLVRWGVENYSEWATFMANLLEGYDLKLSKKEGTNRIVQKIEEM